MKDKLSTEDLVPMARDVGVSALRACVGLLGDRMGADAVQRLIARKPTSASSRALAAIFDFEKPLLKAPPAPDAKYLDEKQLCAELGISPVTATKWRAQAEGPPFVRVGGLIRYARTAVDAWVANRTVGK